MGAKFKDIEHRYNPEFDKLLDDHKHGQLHSVCDYTVIRPAYAYTKQCMDEHWRDGVIPKKYEARLKT